MYLDTHRCVRAELSCLHRGGSLRAIHAPPAVWNEGTSREELDHFANGRTLCEAGTTTAAPVVVEPPEYEVVRPLLAAAAEREQGGIGLAAEVLQGALAAGLERPHLRVLPCVLQRVGLRRHIPSVRD